MRENLFVTSPLLPPLEEFIPYLEQIWQSKQLTNSGPFHQQLEKALGEYLGVKHLSLFSNGTLALLTALQALRIKGEVITTPYSFVATAHTILWNSLTPVFVDIDPVTCNMDPKKIEAAITPETTAILPVHCYGIPCNVQEIQRIADMYDLRVIYDAAHAFGVKEQGESILNHGDLSVLSFHATKVFNTIEGGAIICQDAKMKKRIDDLKNFGFANETTVVATGINGKMNEVQAAFGMLQLQHIDEALEKRKIIYDYYRENIADIQGITLLEKPTEIEWNYAYAPVFVEPSSMCTRDELYENLKLHGIFTRRYFYPLISEFPMYRGLPSAQPGMMPVAESISASVLCLPVFPTLALDEVERIVGLIRAQIERHQFSIDSPLCKTA
ncbi:DegT/DnrJ/EryC1/StrS family aminotransferase [Enterobacter sp. A8]|uniref:DegT/DnrJ/EryC1/StrS family aminotransferase n=1 Tax=Enterobacter sp. A8 TaxID=2507249 RepID=UPI00102EDE83|nr:DegT/DnrJ/EryC1/StrS family aminotransferase [Enterobacter sp. A8]